MRKFVKETDSPLGKKYKKCSFASNIVMSIGRWIDGILSRTARREELIIYLGICLGLIALIFMIPMGLV